MTYPYNEPKNDLQKKYYEVILEIADEIYMKPMTIQKKQI
jgi:hypothetical protein